MSCILFDKIIFSLSDIALIKNNARVAAEIAVELHRLETCASDVKAGEAAEPLRKRAPVS